MGNFNHIRFRVLILCLCMTLSVHAQYKENGKNEITDASGNVSKGKTKNFLQEGEWKTYYPDKSLKSEGSFHEGLKEGKHVDYWPGGKIASIVFYTRGKHDGPFITFGQAGDTTLSSTFSTDVLNGYYMSVLSPSNRDSMPNHLESGQMRGYYSGGLRTGWWVNEGVLKYGGNYLDSTCYVGGKKEGRTISYMNGVRFSDQTFRNGLLHGPSYTYGQKDGVLKTEAYFKNGMADSLYREFIGGVLFIERWYLQGKIYKYSFEYFVGTKDIRTAYYFHSPEVVDSSVTYHQPGKLQSKRWNGSDNVRDSTWIFNRSGGYLEERMVHQPDRLNPKMDRFYLREVYFPNGKVQKISSYDTYGKDSITREYSDNGTLIKEILFEDGFAKGWYSYNYPNGKPKLRARMISGTMTDSLVVYSSTGKILTKGTPEYQKVFKEVDVAETYIFFASVHDMMQDDVEGEAEMILEVVAPPVEPEPDPVVAVPDVMPQFPGGEDSLQAYIAKNMRYPQFEKEAGKDGTVYVEFIVAKDGQITEVKVVKPVAGAPGFTKEAIRLVKSMPKWKPGTVKGNPVRVRVTLPVRFRLD